MALPMHILLAYGYLLVAGWVLVALCGVPMPVTPVLLAAGALSGRGQLNFVLVFVAAWVAAAVADSSWFFVGRRYGRYVMRFLCKLSLEPTTCVRRTEDSIGRSRSVLLFAKFVPALTTLAPAVAGQSGMDYGQFLAYDGAGCALWVGALLVAGRFFGEAIERNPWLLSWVGRFSGALLVLCIAGFFVARVIRRNQILKQLAAARLEPEELKRQLDAGEQVYIVDLRHTMELGPEPFTLPGALHLAPDALTKRHSEIPRDRDVVVFCSCPSEATAAKTAMTLHRLGIERVRPLRGGFDEWKRLGYPVDEISLAEEKAAAPGL